MQQVRAGPSLSHHLQPLDTPALGQGSLRDLSADVLWQCQVCYRQGDPEQCFVQVGAPFHPLPEGVPEWPRALGCSSVRAGVAMAGSSTAAVGSQSACFPSAPPDEEWPASPPEWSESSQWSHLVSSISDVEKHLPRRTSLVLAT